MEIGEMEYESRYSYIVLWIEHIQVENQVVR